MKVLNSDQVINPSDKQSFYNCYSRNLYKFLKYKKGIMEIDIRQNETTKKVYSVFIKCLELQNALDEWKQNKENGTLVFPKIES